MKYLALLWVVFFLTLGCNRQRKGSLKPRQAAFHFFQDRDTDSLKWRWVHTYDPYNGGTYLTSDSLHPRYLFLYKDGTFRKTDAHNASSGKWYLNPEKNAMALIDEMRNGVSVMDASSSLTFRHQLRKLNQDTLILAWQGRHGFVEELYLIEQEIPGSKALNFLKDSIYAPLPVPQVEVHP